MHTDTHERLATEKKLAARGSQPVASDTALRRTSGVLPIVSITLSAMLVPCNRGSVASLPHAMTGG